MATSEHAPVRYFHGGVPGLKPGDLVLPAATTGTARTLTKYGIELGGDHVRRDRVYVTTGRDVGRAYAAFYPDGALYTVQPHGDLEPDPDCGIDGLSWQCQTATVLTVVDYAVLFRTRTVDRWLRMFTPAAAPGGV